MDSMVDYIRWYGDLDFRQKPFTAVDAMILCVASYFDLSPVWTPDAELRLGDCADAAKTLELCITGPELLNRDILIAAASSERFGALRVTDYEHILKPDIPLQFSAVTFRCEDFAFAAYRGTDDSLAGWKENFMISFTETAAQELALDYARRAAASQDRIYIGGHSKGGNLALYAACGLDDEALSHVEQVYLLDGPGCCAEVLAPETVARIDGITTRIVPEFSVVGKLFEPVVGKTVIVKSSAEGIMEHSLATWTVDHGAPNTAEKNAPGSVYINGLLDQWIEKMPQERRAALTDELFAALAAGGADSLSGLTSGLDAMGEVLMGLINISPETRQTFSELPKQAILGDIERELPERLTSSERLKGLADSPYTRAALIMLGGLVLVLSPDNLLPTLAMLLFTGLAVLQCVLTVLHLKRSGWRIEAARERLILCAILIAVCLIVLVKEQALFLIGSVLFGILLLTLGVRSAVGIARREEGRFMKAVRIVEAVFFMIYGVDLLIIPQSTLFAFTVSLGVMLMADGAARLVYHLVKK